MQAIQAVALTAAVLFVILMVIGLVTLILPVMVICGTVALTFMIIYQYLKVNKNKPPR